MNESSSLNLTMDDSDTSSGALEDGCTLQSNPESLMLMRPKLLELHRQLVMLIYPFIGGEDIEKAHWGRKLPILHLFYPFCGSVGCAKLG